MFGLAAANWPIIVCFGFSWESHYKEACCIEDESKVDMWKEAKMSFVKNWREGEICGLHFLKVSNSISAHNVFQ